MLDLVNALEQREWPIYADDEKEDHSETSSASTNAQNNSDDDTDVIYVYLCIASDRKENSASSTNT